MPKVLEAPLLGALLLAAVSSVPMHIMPIVIATAIKEGRASVELAGWTGSACIAGELLVLIMLPTLGFGAIGRIVAACASAILVVGLLASGTVPFPSAILAWGIVGVGCGVLKFLGNIRAAVSSDPTFAITVRLIFVLVFSGAIAILPTINNQISLSEVSNTTAACLATILLIGLLLLSRHSASWPHSNDSKEIFPCVKIWTGLLFTTLFFIGQAGFIAFVVHIMNVNGTSIAHAALMIGAAKLVSAAALALLAAAAWKTQNAWILGAVLTVSILGVLYGSGIQVFVSICVLEISLNLSSAGLQGAVAAASPRAGAAWLGTAILTGIILGGPLHGLAMTVPGGGTAFIAFVIVTSFLPALSSQLLKSKIS